MPSCATPISAAKPIDTATGTETAKKISIDKIMSCDMASLAFLESNYRVVNRRWFCSVQPARNHTQDGQGHAYRYGDINPRNGEFQTGERLEAHAPGHLRTHPCHKAEEADANQHDEMF